MLKQGIINFKGQALITNLKIHGAGKHMISYKKASLVMYVGFIFGSAYCMEDWYSAIEALDPSFNFSDGEYEISPQKPCMLAGSCAVVKSTWEVHDTKDESACEKIVTQQKAQEGCLTRKRKLSSEKFHFLPTVSPRKRIYYNGDLFECEVCSLKFSYYRDLRSHRCKEHISGSVMCSCCKKFYPTIGSLNRHVLVVHGPQYRKGV